MNVTLSNKHNLPLSLAVFLAKDDYTGPSLDAGVKTISVTTLLKSTRQIVLGFRLPTETFTDVADLIASRVGQAYHTAVEEAWLDAELMDSLESLNVPKGVRKRIRVNPDPATVLDTDIPIYLEQRAEMRIGKWTLSGKFDLIMNGTLEDIKSTGTYTYTSQNKVDDFAMQGSMYKMLNPDIITSSHIQINYIFTDWAAFKVNSMANYPPLKLFYQKIPLHSIPQTRKFVEAKLREIDKYMEADEVNIPHCNDRDLWRTTSIYQYFASPESKKATKNFDNLVEANTHLITKNKGFVKIKPGEVKACKYCAAFNLCTQKDAYIESGELKL